MKTKMKDEVKLLRKAQKVLWDNLYPGYPLQISVVMDLAEDTAWVDYKGYKTNLHRAMEIIQSATCFHALECNKVTKGNWLIDRTAEEVDEILKAKDEDFYIFDYDILKFYFGLASALVNIKDKKKGFIFGVYDEDCCYVDVKVFGENDKDKIQKYVEEYFTNQEGE